MSNNCCNHPADIETARMCGVQLNKRHTNERHTISPSPPPWVAATAEMASLQRTLPGDIDTDKELGLTISVFSKQTGSSLLIRVGLSPGGETDTAAALRTRPRPGPW